MLRAAMATLVLCIPTVVAFSPHAVGSDTTLSGAASPPVEGRPLPEEHAHTAQGTPSDVLTALTTPTLDDASLASGKQATPGENRSVGPLYATGGPSVVQDTSLAGLASVTDRSRERLFGENRYETAAAIAREGFPAGASTVLIATGVDFPDGLAASAVAGVVHAPLLLTTTTSLPAATAAEVSHLRPTSIVVAGGPAVVSDAVVRQLSEAVPGATVDRVHGADRYTTAAALAKLVPVQHELAYVATGANFPDALSAGPAAAKGQAPLLLTTATTLAAGSKSVLSQLRPRRTIILGGPDVVSDTVVAQIQQATGGMVERAFGADRYETAAAVATTAFSGLAPAEVLATGQDFPDALTAGAFAAALDSPLLLDAGQSTAPRATVDAARRLSWWVPDSGAVLRYIPVVHPDDEMSARSVLAPADPARYDVYILLTRGESSAYCNGQPVSNQWMSLEYLPQPQPTGLALSDRCKQHRLDSWETFLSDERAAAGDVDSYARRKGSAIVFDGRSLPTPMHLNAEGVEEPADYFDVAVGPHSARVVFDLGELQPDEVIWAIENVRQLRAELFPTQVEGDIVGAGFHNATTTGSIYIHPDHQALHDVLGTVDFDLPGSQYGTVGHEEEGRTFGAWVSEYCSLMCHPAGPVGFDSNMGDFQYSYGWLSSGRWQAGTTDVTAGFSEYQSFAKWF